MIKIDSQNWVTYWKKKRDLRLYSSWLKCHPYFFPLYNSLFRRPRYSGSSYTKVLCLTTKMTGKGSYKVSPWTKITGKDWENVGPLNERQGQKLRPVSFLFRLSKNPRKFTVESNISLPFVYDDHPIVIYLPLPSRYLSLYQNRPNVQKQRLNQKIILLTQRNIKTEQLLD